MSDKLWPNIWLEAVLWSVENLTLGAIGFSYVVFGFSQVLKSDLCKKPLDRHPFDSAGPVTSSQLIPKHPECGCFANLVPWRCWVFQMFWWDCNHNRRVIETQMFWRWKRSNPNNPSTRHVRFRFLDENWKYQMPVWMEDLYKAIAKVIVLFDGEEEISTELRESLRK